MAEILLDQLRKEHETVKDIFRNMIESSPDGNNRKELTGRLVQELKPHLKAEEAVFYSRLVDVDKSREKAFQAIEEHHVTDIILNELLKLDTKDERWSAKAQVLQEIVQHHIQEEEKEIFKLARELFDEDDMQEIYDDFVTSKDDWLGRLAA